MVIFLSVYSAEYWISADIALSAAIVLILVYLPGRPPYYGAAATVVAKIYSNSMMTMLNSRIQPASNVPTFASPLWNELVKPDRISREIWFRKSSGTDFRSSLAQAPHFQNQMLH